MYKCAGCIVVCTAIICRASFCMLYYFLLQSNIFLDGGVGETTAVDTVKLLFVERIYVDKIMRPYKKVTEVIPDFNSHVHVITGSSDAANVPPTNFCCSNELHVGRVCSFFNFSYTPREVEIGKRERELGYMFCESDEIYLTDIFISSSFFWLFSLQPSKLNVYKNDSESWDYTNPNLGKLFPFFLVIFYFVKPPFSFYVHKMNSSMHYFIVLCR